MQPLRIGGHDDHIHALLKIPARATVADIVRTIKTNSSRWIHDNKVLNHTFAWQEGYSAFGVSESSAMDVIAYISRQAEHHRNISFQEELITFLKKNGIQYDERYMWS